MREHGVMNIVDIQPMAQYGAHTNLIVLHMGDIDKLVGTTARHPVCKITMFEMSN
jgi:hypothetical protein